MKRFNLRHQCALGALAGAMAFAPSAASAQDTATTEQDTDLVAAADVDDGNVIIVRAQGRDQTLSDVPVAVSAVTAETLQKSGVADIRDMNQVAIQAVVVNDAPDVDVMSMKFSERASSRRVRSFFIF